MLKNLKRSITFVLVMITMLFLVVFMTLAASKPVSSMNIRTDVTQKGEVLEGEKWPGLGMSMFTAWDNSVMDGYVDTLMTNGFDQLRIDIPSYQDTAWLEASKAGVINAVSKGAKVIWGVSSNKYDDPSYTITASNWPDFRQAILDAARWAQDNGVYEFQIGNEEEYHIDETTMTEVQIIKNLKAVATEVQSIFTNGKVSYSCGRYPLSNWISLGKGDVDLLALNVYQGGTTFSDRWKTDISGLVSAFGSSGTYITEFNLSSISLDSYSTDEGVQAEALSEMIDYIKGSGISRAFYFCWNDSKLGAMESGGTYRQLWGAYFLN